MKAINFAGFGFGRSKIEMFEDLPISSARRITLPQAHRAAAEGDQEAVANIEKRIDELVAEMWGLTKEELKEIQKSLAELKT